VVGRVIEAIGWHEEGMQTFLHFEGGGYLTVAARSRQGVAYLAGYYSDTDPATPDGYLLLDDRGGSP